MDASFQKKEQSIKFNQNDYWQNHFLSGIIFDRLDGMIMAYVHIRKNMIYESCASVYYGKENAQIVMMRNKSSLMKKWYIGPSEQVRFEKLMSDRIKNYH
jgi:hypothetical protein